MADAQDSKSCVGDYVWVQVPSPAFFNPLRKRQHRIKYDSVLLFCHSGAQNEIFSVLCPKVSSFSAVFSGVGAQNVLFVA